MFLTLYYFHITTFGDLDTIKQSVIIFWLYGGLSQEGFKDKANTYFRVGRLSGQSYRVKSDSTMEYYAGDRRKVLRSDVFCKT